MDRFMESKLHEINETVSVDNRSCCRIWNNVESIIEKFDMTSLDELINKI